LKIAFITHTTIVGGAAISSAVVIQYLIDTGLIRPEECIIIHNKENKISSEKNDVYFNLKKTIKFFKFRLPFSLVFKGGQSNFFKKLFRICEECISIFCFIFFYNNLLKREKITTVHLNSLVLWPLLLVLPRSMKKIIHIREVPDNSIEARIAINTIRILATEIISIDTITDIPFALSGKSRIVSNPFNMTESRRLREIKESIKMELGIPPKSFVVSLLGPVGKQKGIDFLIKIIKEYTHTKNLEFIILGNPQGLDGERYVQELKRYENVKYFTEQKDTEKFYAITDVVIRCEDYLPLGRTVWEGIFAGGLALVPVNKNDDISVIKEYLEKYIFTYQALDVNSCVRTLNNIIEKYPDTIKNSGYPHSDNVASSSELFYKVIQDSEK
jgi:glycosyltransferase involved in cell wall biosynthesis